jgi:hypothetical protein
MGDDFKQLSQLLVKYASHVAIAAIIVIAVVLAIAPVDSVGRAWLGILLVVLVSLIAYRRVVQAGSQWIASRKAAKQHFSDQVDAANELARQYGRREGVEATRSEFPKYIAHGKEIHQRQMEDAVAPVADCEKVVVALHGILCAKYRCDVTVVVVASNPGSQHRQWKLSAVFVNRKETTDQDYQLQVDVLEALGREGRPLVIDHRPGLFVPGAEFHLLPGYQACVVGAVPFERRVFA